jgi:hypothetical protein
VTTISDGTTTLTPLLVLGWSPTREARSRAHPLIGSPNPDVTLRPHASRSGTLRILCEDESAAAAMEALHTAGLLLTLADPDLASVGMTYAVTGPVNPELDPQTRRRWVVSADFTEVSP